MARNTLAVTKAQPNYIKKNVKTLNYYSIFKCSTNLAIIQYFFDNIGEFYLNTRFFIL